VFGDKVHSYRATRRMSQQELADIVGDYHTAWKKQIQSIYVVGIQYCKSIRCNNRRFIIL